jgi:hypothetical protein
MSQDQFRLPFPAEELVSMLPQRKIIQAFA